MITVGMLAKIRRMAIRVRDELDQSWMSTIADCGYYYSEELFKCRQAGIEAIVPKATTSNATAEGRFSRTDFLYEARQDEYRCPARERLIYRMTTIEHGMTFRRYWSSHFGGYAL